jgi:hypothetical protein
MLTFCLLGSLSCKVIRSNVSKDINRDSETQTPQIIFLNYTIKLDRSKGDYEIILINKIITEGKLKLNSTESETPKPGDLKCITLNNHMEPIDSLIISDPLNITVESVNENNALFKKEVARDSAQFSIRLQLTEKIYAIAIRKGINSENQNSYQLITKIKEP